MTEQNNDSYKNRAYGFVVIKAINSNYNADFSGQPRTLPNGQVYATDKALKYTVRHFLKDAYPEKGVDGNRILFYKRYNKEINPFDLVEAYKNMYSSEVKNDNKEKIITNLLSCLDVRFFGATFAPKGSGIKDKNISIHGPVQINHGVNKWAEGNIFSEQITSPFRNPGKKKSETGNENEDKAQTTIGRQSKLEEGHYVHHFSINPKNLEDIVKHGQEGTQTLSINDIELLKEGLRKGATYYDSAAKAGTENEILFYVELVESSKLVLPNFTEMVKVSDSKKDGKRYFDMQFVKEELEKHSNEISVCEVYYNDNNVVIDNLPENCIKRSL